MVENILSFGFITMFVMLLLSLGAVTWGVALYKNRAFGVIATALERRLMQWGSLSLAISLPGLLGFAIGIIYR